MEGHLLTIEGKPVNKLIKYEILYVKSWGDDAGKDMAGNMKGTFLGIYPNLQLEIGAGNENELSSLAAILNRPNFSVTYYDVEKETFYTGSYYADDITLSLKQQQQMRFNSYQVKLNPVARRQ